MQVIRYTRFLFQNSDVFQSCSYPKYKQIVTIPEGRSWCFKNFLIDRRRFRFIREYPDMIISITCANMLLCAFAVTLKRLPVILKGHSINIVKHCTEQCEFIIAHRIRRSQQIISLYTKLWDEVALKQFVSKLRTKFIKRGNILLLSSWILYNWDQERIKDEDILKYQNELEVIKELQQKKYCVKKDEKDKCSCFNCLSPGELEWNIFIEKENLIVWKKEETKHIGEGLYCYKMYGRYDDVTALNFLEAQVDLDYRLTWDDHAVKLKTIDSERSTRSDVIYWETKWPALFSNRDYVFNRRYYIDPKRKLVTLVNKSTYHPSVPSYPNKQRITEYWSYMVIKPYTDMDKPGIEFSLTYFDNPGIQMPSSLSSYVTVTGMPAFLKHLHDAALKLDQVRKGPSILFDPDESSDGGKSKPPPEEKPKEPKKKCSKLPDLSSSQRSNFEKLYDMFFIF